MNSSGTASRRRGPVLGSRASARDALSVLLSVLAVALPGTASGDETAGVGTASASGTTSALSWVRLPGAESCIPTSELGTRVEAYLRRPALVPPSTADISIEGRAHVEEKGAARRFRVVVGGARRDGTSLGTRELVSRGADCRSLDDEIVLVIALLIDPDAMARPRDPPPGPEERAEAPPPPVAPLPIEIVRERVIVREVPARPEGSGGRAVVVDAFALGAVGLARVPSLAPAALLGVRAEVKRHLAAELSFSGTAPSEHALPDGRVRASLLEVGLAVCPTTSPAPRLTVDACLGARGGDLRLSGRGFSLDAEGHRAFVDATGGVRGRLTVAGPLFALVSASLFAPLVRHRATVTGPAGGETVVYERASVAAEVGLGFGLRFHP